MSTSKSAPVAQRDPPAGRRRGPSSSRELELRLGVGAAHGRKSSNPPPRPRPPAATTTAEQALEESSTPALAELDADVVATRRRRTFEASNPAAATRDHRPACGPRPGAGSRAGASWSRSGRTAIAFSGSRSTSCLESSLKRFLRARLLLTSGWYWRASRGRRGGCVLARGRGRRRAPHSGLVRRGRHQPSGAGHRDTMTCAGRGRGLARRRDRRVRTRHAQPDDGWWYPRDPPSFINAHADGLRGPRSGVESLAGLADPLHRRGARDRLHLLERRACPRRAGSASHAQGARSMRRAPRATPPQERVARLLPRRSMSRAERLR